MKATLDSKTPSDSASEPFRSLTHFGGFDWAMDEHQLAVVDRDGTVLLNLRFSNDAQGWSNVRAKIAAYPRLGVAIETNCWEWASKMPARGRVIRLHWG